MLHRTDLSETKYVIGLPSLQLDVQCTYGERLHPKDLKMTSAYKRAESTASSSVIIKMRLFTVKLSLTSEIQ